MLEKKRDIKAWLYIGIPLILLGVFTFFPLIKTILIAFMPGYNSILDNFEGARFSVSMFPMVWQYSRFQDALITTLLLVVISVPIATILALLIAVALNSIKPLQKLFQTIFFLPYVTNTIAIGMVFAVLFDQQSGLINMLFNINKDWVGTSADKASWIFVVIIHSIWSSLAFKILVFIGGLQNISKQYYDSAKVDSTPKFRVFTRITVPLLSPMISYILITSFIGAFKSYESVVGVFTAAGVDQSIADSRTTVVGFVYQMIGMFGEDYYSRGAAAAVTLFGIILVFTLIQLAISKKRVHY